MDSKHEMNKMELLQVNGYIAVELNLEYLSPGYILH